MGSEARSRVPDQFVAQDPLVSNPPTLLLAINKLVKWVSRNEGKSKPMEMEIAVDGVETSSTNEKAENEMTVAEGRAV